MEKVKSFLATLMSAVSNCTLYSKEHASVSNLTRRAFSELSALLDQSDNLECMIVGNDLIVNKEPLRGIGLQGLNLMKRLKRKELSGVNFLKGITFPELLAFIADISNSAQAPVSSAHIKTGAVDIRLGGPGKDTDFDIKMEGLTSIASEQIATVKEVYHGLTPFKELNITGLEEVVVNFIVTFRREANILKLISPVKSFSEYTYTHATNVAVLSMFQAETMGVCDDLLRDIGISALLHDVGKLFIAKEVLEKQGALDEKEWEEIRMHPVSGAKYLTKAQGLPRLAPVVAIEHHRKFDGTGYPKFMLSDKKQHLCSQIVAISDYFDALRSRRPYRKALDIKEVISIMKRERGSGFNPVLLDNFILSIHKALSE
jgi:HD-GYP domain-containing protein (c-di-GMP phosphodiesterase class II)